tara:strand:+ start:713 stop:1471 length:759 start_codon:yes stop_codon:yes gene_type:complete
MRRHTTFRTGNPTLTASTFKDITNNTSERMTLEGSVNKSGISLLILMFTAFYTFSTNNANYIWPGFIGGFILAIITMFKKEWSPYTVPMYAGLEGLALGGISLLFNNIYPGIAQQAVFLTFGIFGALLFAYKTKMIQATENFRLGIFAATAGIGIAYLINFIVSWWSGSNLYFMTMGQPGAPAPMISIGFSLFVVIIAALNLVLDFDFIEQGAEIGAPKYMEWYAAFGLLVTLIWLYLEILRLLAKLQSRRN